ncbi:hypothetical protein [Sediminibacterium goheungense]|uniref:Uncharacterized protein n=1 Tax=Sediminibacterium goheungense TaxID=1086393 RepID=A0A4R6ITB1_9BACT|nr:hypothetical protein [Sediminibacterium goheungense]TDO25762.1 hypothetical protein BC659_2685 [Sediminibacterium goheungense]
MKHWNLLIVFCCCGIIHLSAQRALPGFTVEELSKGKISISWINPYPTCNQLAVQRSTDGINFRTIFSAQSPELPRNGYVDSKVPVAPKVYYRIFYVLAGGSYFFTEIKSGTDINKETTNTDPLKKQEDINARITLPTEPVKETVVTKDSSKNEVVEKTIKIYKRGTFLYQFNVQAYKNFRDSIIQYTQDSLSLIKPGEVNWKPFVPKPKEYVSVFVKDTLLVQIELPFYKRFKDSVAAYTKDTLVNITTFRAELSRFVPKQVWKPSIYVYTNTSGYLNISLPAQELNAYRIVFFDADNKELFRVNKIKEAELTLDKANFKHSGWFNFELYKHNELVEKNKFFLQKD